MRNLLLSIDVFQQINLNVNEDGISAKAIQVTHIAYLSANDNTSSFSFKADHPFLITSLTGIITSVLWGRIWATKTDCRDIESYKSSTIPPFECGFKHSLSYQYTHPKMLRQASPPIRF